ncbi:conserved protein of unknown function [Streptomyces sp. KY75]|nr:conserved protein of unknown function [Streptomyces sp. KY70]CAD5974925.1 conserved protein of unknown function [Streptomyces sp. KY75]
MCKRLQTASVPGRKLYGDGKRRRAGGVGVEHDALDAGEARYELVISVDARGSGQYSDAEKPLMRRQIYEVLETAFAQAGVGRNAVHLEDRGDGVLISVPGRIAVARLLGLWMTELHEKLRLDNRRERRPLGLRVAMHVGPDPHTRQQLQHLLTELLHHQRADTAGATRLAARLQDLPDRPLLTLLGAEDLPWASSSPSWATPAACAPATTRPRTRSAPKCCGTTSTSDRTAGTRRTARRWRRCANGRATSSPGRSPRSYGTPATPSTWANCSTSWSWKAARPARTSCAGSWSHHRAAGPRICLRSSGSRW